MKLKTVSLLGLSALVLSLGSLQAVGADPTTFAQFQEQDSSVNAFSFTNAGSASTFHVVGSSIPVKFSYGVFNGYNGNSTAVINAHLSFTADVAAPAVGGVIDVQPLKNINMIFTADTPVNGMNNLLTVSGSTGTLFGKDQGHTASFEGDTATGDIVNYSSDFLFFTNTTERDFSLSFSSLIPIMRIASNGYLDSFTASGTGTFASSPAPIVPDGASLPLLSGGLLPMAGFSCYFLRRRRAGC